MFCGILVGMSAVTWIYAKGYEGGSGLQEGLRFGATLALPITRSQSIKIYGVTGYNGHRHHDFDAVGIAWQYRWGGGL